MSIKINRESTNQEKIQTLNLVSIIEKYYLPKDIPSSESKNSKTQNLDTNLSDIYLYYRPIIKKILILIK